MNRRKLFARSKQTDAFIENRIHSTAKWEFTPEGQHIELGIAEMNLMLLLGAAGLSHSLFGKRLVPGRAGQFRTGLCRRTGGDHGMGVCLCST